MLENTTPRKKLRGKEKLAKIPVKIEETVNPLRKPDWIRIKLSPSNKVADLKKMFREKRLATVCEEASCPNLNECFSGGTATFMVMGDICTRRCSFCDVAHGRPNPLDLEEPKNLAQTVKTMELKYVVITSVDRDDLNDRGAKHFTDCVNAVREANPGISVEILVPDFRHRIDLAVDVLSQGLPDVFAHNIETVPRLYLQVRPVASYEGSLDLLKAFKLKYPSIPTKAGLMLGIGETFEEVKEVLKDLRTYLVDRVTLGQYLQPSRFHMPVDRYVTPQEFIELGKYAKELGFTQVTSGPLVRSSYHADEQNQHADIFFA